MSSAAALKVRASVLRAPGNRPGLLIVEGRQLPFTLDSVWKSPVVPSVNMAVNVDFDSQGNITAITAVDPQQAAREKLNQIGRAAQQHGKVSPLHLAESSASPHAATGRLSAVALVLVCVLGSLAPRRLQAQNITTVAGNGIFGYSGDNGPATNAELNYPYHMAVDRAGNLYIADSGNGRVRKVDASGTITTVAGGGSGCPEQTDSVGDGCPATSAEIAGSAGVAVDSAGNLYIANAGDSRIRKVDTSGIITTVAGNGTLGYSGRNGPATSAELYYPYGVAVDGAGNLYIADSSAEILKVDTSAIMTIVAGGGSGCPGQTDSLGDGCPGASAELTVAGSSVTDVAVDSAGNIYIAVANNCRIRKVNTSGIITTVAGTGGYAGYDCGYSGDNGPATSAEINGPYGVGVDSAGNIYIADIYNNAIRKVDTSGIITTVAGGGRGCPGQTDSVGDGCPATSAELYTPTGATVDGAGHLYLADYNDARVREVTIAIGPPTDKDQCKDGGWQTFNFPRMFKNQGDCVSFVNTGK